MNDRHAVSANGALLIVDMINLFDFKDGDVLARHALAPARRTAALRDRFREAGAPVIYGNDNFSHWQSDFHALVEQASQPGAPGSEIAMTLNPGKDDYTVLKPQHSAFHGTPLRLLLSQLAVTRVVVAGIAGEACVLATAIDAKMAALEVVVAGDCTASMSRDRNDRALTLLQEAFAIDVVDSEDFAIGRSSPRHDNQKEEAK